jgi:hypothetical protein
LQAIIEILILQERDAKKAPHRRPDDLRAVRIGRPGAQYDSGGSSGGGDPQNGPQVPWILQFPEEKDDPLPAGEVFPVWFLYWQNSQNTLMVDGIRYRS